MTAEHDSHGGDNAPDATDAELVRRCRVGDAAAFDALVRRHYRAAHAVAVAVMRNAMDAEDVVQDGFGKALERLDDCRDGATFGPWLRQIVRRRALNARDARRVRDTDLLEPATAAGADDPLRDVETLELGDRLEGGPSSVGMGTRGPAMSEGALLDALWGDGPTRKPQAAVWMRDCHSTSVLR